MSQIESDHGPFLHASVEVYDLLSRVCDYVVLRQSIMALGFDATADVDDDELVEIYLKNPLVAALSPNLFFDEQWYRRANPDVSEAIKAGHAYSGFTHYVMFGLFEGRWPNPALQSLKLHPSLELPRATELDDAAYLAAHPSAALFIRHFPILTPLLHYNLFGRFLGLAPGGASVAPVPPDLSPFERIAVEFDPQFYRENYLQGEVSPRFYQDPFSHYLIYGIPRAHSPNEFFDEAWYRAFYPEIRAAIDRGEVLSGFYHFIAAGKAEGRLPKFDRKGALEARIPGVTNPALMHRVAELRSRLLYKKPVSAAALPARIWFLLPTINPDITFGGYRSAFELLNAAHLAGYNVGIICTEDMNSDKEYFLWRETSGAFKQLVSGIPFVNLAREPHVQIGLNDTLVVYSVWDLYTAEHMRKAAPDLRVVLLTQEYEPVFHDNSSVRAILEDAYQIPHFALINSGFLCKFLKQHKVGVFGRTGRAVAGRDYAVFEHRINLLPSQPPEVMRQRQERVLVAYARPEGHAARNMFEILILALQQICAEGLFGPEWSFVGLGALTDLAPIALGGGHELVMHPKMTEEEYTRCISCMDIGISLMFAPHPSVMPFEFATTGALVVTNAYENRSAEELAGICPNIIAGPPSLAGVVRALRQALAQVGDVEKRMRQRFRPPSSNWGDIFNGALLEIAFGPVPGAEAEDKMVEGQATRVSAVRADIAHAAA